VEHNEVVEWVDVIVLLIIDDNLRYSLKIFTILHIFSC